MYFCVLLILVFDVTFCFTSALTRSMNLPAFIECNPGLECKMYNYGIRPLPRNNVIKLRVSRTRAFRIIFGSMYTSYNVLSEFNLASLWQRRQNLLHSFGEKLLSSDKFCVFAPPVKNCTRVLRSNAQASLTVPFYNTERYRNSTIPAINQTPQPLSLVFFPFTPLLILCNLYIYF